MQKDFVKNNLPILLALIIALIAAGIYFFSGRSSLDKNVRELEKTTTVDHVESKENSLIVKCKNGESYQIIYKEGQTDYQDLVYNKCGDAGVAQMTTQESKE